jgi:hypothetical protein
VKAFANSPKPYLIRGINVIFADMKFAPDTVKSFKSADQSLELQARYIDPPDPGVEYRISVLSANAGDVDIPDKYVAPAEPAPKEKSSDSSGVLWVILGLAALAAGVLVYLRMLQTPRKPIKKS